MNGVYRQPFRYGPSLAMVRRSRYHAPQLGTSGAGTLCAHLVASQPLTARLLVTPILAARLKAVQCGE